MGDSDMGKWKTGDTAQQVAGTKKARTSDADADADFCTDAVMLGGPRSDMDNVAGTADGDNVSTLDTSLSPSLPSSGGRPTSRERQRRDSPRGGLMTQGGQLVVANPADPVPQPQGDDLAGIDQAIAVIYSPTPLAAAPFQIIAAPFDELDRLLSPGFQERAAASAVTARQ